MIREICQYTNEDGNKNNYYFRGIIRRSVISPKGILEQDLAYIEDIYTGETCLVQPEYLNFISHLNAHRDLFKLIKNNIKK